MVFKNFRFNIVIRVILLNITILAIIWLVLSTNYYITAFSLTSAAVLQIIFLIHFAERTNTMFVKFLNAIRYDDYAQTYTIKGLGKSFDELNEEFNQVVVKFQEIRAEKEAQYHYLKTIVQHIAIGLIVLDEKGNIDLMNNAAKNLLLLGNIQHIHQLGEGHQTLLSYINEPHSYERELIKIQQSEKVLHLALRTTEIKLMNKNYRIISLQDIQSELEEKEMEAWQNLIRVLTHEIINSVTPIASLAATVDEDLNYHIEQVEHNEREIAGEKMLVLPLNEFQQSIEDVHFAIKTIQRRSEGLIRFVKDFRSLTKVPMPNLRNLAVKDLIESVVFLMREEFKRQQIEFQLQIEPMDLQVIADPQLMEQVFINLLKNASQALEDKPLKKIEIKAYKDHVEKVLIEVSDNGSGISEEAIKNIFIPFFTTKKTGSGIGLSLSRQVMRLHGGSISVQSALGEGTTFTLRFP